MVRALYRAAYVSIHRTEDDIVYFYVGFRKCDKVTVLFKLIVLNRVSNWLDMHSSARTTLIKARGITLKPKHLKVIALHMERTDRRMVTHLLRDILEVLHDQLVGLPQHWIKRLLCPSLDVVVHDDVVDGAESQSHCGVGSDVCGSF